MAGITKDGIPSIIYGNLTLSGTDRLLDFGEGRGWQYDTSENEICWPDLASATITLGLPGDIRITEMAAPTGVVNTARIYAEDNGSGKTRLMVIFGTGAAQQIAIEP